MKINNFVGKGTSPRWLCNSYIFAKISETSLKLKELWSVYVCVGGGGGGEEVLYYPFSIRQCMVPKCITVTIIHSEVSKSFEKTFKPSMKYESCSQYVRLS